MTVDPPLQDELFLLCGHEPYGSTWPLAVYPTETDAIHDMARVEMERAKEFHTRRNLDSVPGWSLSNTGKRLRAPPCYELWKLNTSTGEASILNHY